jgi:glutamate racemase
MKNQPIGILDSGIGGLSVYQEITSILPHEPIIYIGDNALVPYGKLSEEMIYERSSKLVSFLLEKGAKVIVVACNTITVSCINRLREAFPQVTLIGTVPVIKTAGAQTKNGRIGILSTTKTAASDYQKNLMEQFASSHIVINKGTDQLVPLIEKGEIDGAEMHHVLEGVLSDFQKEQIDTLVLGCTHYPFVKKEMHSILGDGVQLLDSGAAIARQVKRVLEEKNALREEGHASMQLYTTGNAEHISSIAKKLLGVTIAAAAITL